MLVLPAGVVNAPVCNPFNCFNLSLITLFIQFVTKYFVRNTLEFE